MTKPIWEQINEKHSLTELIQFSNGRHECFNGGNTSSPSVEYYPHTDTAYCHKCRRIFDFISLYALQNNLDYSMAIKELAIKDNIPFGKVDKQYLEKHSKIREIYQSFMEKCHSELKKDDLFEKIKLRRGFTNKTMEKWQIGLFNEVVRELLTSKYDKEDLYEAGLLFESGTFLCGDRIVYPYLDHSSKPIYFAFRAIDGKPDFMKSKDGRPIKYIKLLINKKDKNKKNIGKREHVKNTLLGLNTINKIDKPLIITEGFTDLISVVQCGYPCLSPVTINFKVGDLEELVRFCKRFKEVYIINDNEVNKAGLNGSVNTLKVLLKEGINVNLGEIPRPVEKDKIDLDEYLKVNMENMKESQLEQNEKLDKLIKKSIEGFDYLLKSFNEESTMEQFNEIFKLLPEGNHVLTNKTIKKLVKNTCIDKRAIQKQHKTYLKSIISKEIKESVKEAIEIVIPEDYIKKVENLLLKEDKFKEIKEVLDFYIYGEDRNKMILFTLLSGTFYGLYSIIAVIGRSSDGKSYLVENVLKLFPERNYKIMTNASDKYMQYLAKDENIRENLLILFFNEAQRNRNVLETMKDMGDDGIKAGTLEKDELGNYHAVDLNLGKLSLVLTSTIENLNLELLNRAWRLEPDESEAQNRRIVEEDYSRKKEPWRSHENEEAIIETVNTIKYALETIRSTYDFDGIAIPFTESLKPLLEFKKVQVRRDKNKLIDLIKHIAAWQFRIRDYIEVNGKKYLIAHPNDLKTALEHDFLNIFVNMAKNLTPEKITIMKRINQMTTEATLKFRTNEILKKLKDNDEFSGGKSTLIRRLKVLVEDGYLNEETDPSDKRRHIYQSLVEDLKEDGDLDAVIEAAEHEYAFFMEGREVSKQ